MQKIEMANTKTAICKVQFDGDDWKNILTVESPTGDSVTFTTNGTSNSMSVGLIKKIAEIHKQWKNGKSTDCGEIEFTFDQMAELKKLGGR